MYHSRKILLKPGLVYDDSWEPYLGFRVRSSRIAVACPPDATSSTKVDFDWLFLRAVDASTKEFRLTPELMHLLGYFVCPRSTSSMYVYCVFMHIILIAITLDMTCFSKAK